MSDNVILALTGAVGAIIGGLFSSVISPYFQGKLRRVATPKEEQDANDIVVQHFQKIIDRLETEVERQGKKLLDMSGEHERCESALDAMTEQNESQREQIEELTRQNKTQGTQIEEMRLSVAVLKKAFLREAAGD